MQYDRADQMIVTISISYFPQFSILSLIRVDCRCLYYCTCSGHSHLLWEPLNNNKIELVVKKCGFNFVLLIFSRRYFYKLSHYAMKILYENICSNLYNHIYWSVFFILESDQENLYDFKEKKNN